LLNVTLVERPVRFLTLRSVINAALRHRRHQYEIRDTLRDLQQAQVDLQTANRELENRVHERTRKLQETISELEAFSYSVSHDLRAPLRSMQGYAHALLEDYSAQLDEQGKKFLTKISSGAARLDLLVQDILAYSRIAKGQVTLENVSPGDIIRDVIDTYPHLRDKAAITIKSPLPAVCAHPAYLTQCVSNLLGNAVKFVAPGVQPRVTIWAEPEPGTDYIRLCFEDNGIGIAPEHFRDIFEIFGRVNANHVYEGTGIGLAIVRKAAERMGGGAAVTSELGKGSRFWLSLRRAA
jgi:signal transduction histidine kinase